MASSSSSDFVQDGRVLRRANPNTIQDKFLVGYQGWFTCAGDGPPVHRGHHGWLHWFDKPIPDGGQPNIDLWPDTSEYSPSELHPAPGLTMADGSPACLFSSRNPKTVYRHFHWMALHGVDGAFFQRFAGQCEVDGRLPGEGGNADIMQLRDEVLRVCRTSAEKAGRVFAIMYDVSGVPADRIEHVIKVDWVHLVRDLAVLDSPNYLREGGKPVIALWGFGFAGRRHNPSTVRSIIRHLRSTTPGGAYIMAGAPTHWATLTGDADPNPGFRDIWMHEFDAISPWTIGRYNNEGSADKYASEKVKTDMALLSSEDTRRGRKVDYVPVVFPGGSGFNLSHGNWGLNDIPRNGGRFYWRQIYNARKEGARIIYGAMWDEYDEGTVILPVVSSKRLLPSPGKFLALDADGQDLPPDWYMRISCFAGELLRGERQLDERFPNKELMDYWAGRPKYEERIGAVASGSGSSAAGSSTGPGTSSTSTVIPEAASPAPAMAASTSSSSVEQDPSSGITQTFEQWSAESEELKDEAPPPPYSLEAGDGEAVSDEEPAAVSTTVNTAVPATSDQPTPVATTPNVSQAPVGGASLGHSVSLGGGVGSTRPTSIQSVQSAHSVTSIGSSHSAHSALSAGGSSYIPPSRTSSLQQSQQTLPQHQGRPQVGGLGHSASVGHHSSVPGSYGAPLSPNQHQYHGFHSAQQSPNVNALTSDFARYTLSDTPASTPHSQGSAFSGSTSQPHSPLPPQSPLPHSAPPRPSSGGFPPPPIPAGGAPRPQFSNQQWPPADWQVPSSAPPVPGSSSTSSHQHSQQQQQPITAQYNPITGWYRPPPTVSSVPTSPHTSTYQQPQAQIQSQPHTPHSAHATWGMPQPQQPGRLSPGHPNPSFHGGSPSSPAAIPSPTHGANPIAGGMPNLGAVGFFPKPQIPGQHQHQQFGHGHSGGPGVGSSTYPQTQPYGHGYGHGPQHSHHNPPPRTSSLATGGGELYNIPVPYGKTSPSPSNESAYGGMFDAPSQVQGQTFLPSSGSSANTDGFSAPLPSANDSAPYLGAASGSFTPPQPPPRPPTRPPTSNADSSTFGTPNANMPTPASQGRLVGVASEAYSLALGTVGKVAGPETRKQFEKGVDTLTASGSKLFGRFMK